MYLCFEIYLFLSTLLLCVIFLATYGLLVTFTWNMDWVEYMTLRFPSFWYPIVVKHVVQSLKQLATQFLLIFILLIRDIHNTFYTLIQGLETNTWILIHNIYVSLTITLSPLRLYFPLILLTSTFWIQIRKRYISLLTLHANFV